MEIGICGKPNSGKSTLFSAATLVDIPMENYPFTTIKPNVGVSYVKVDCVCKELGIKCNPKHGKCIDGKRYIPIKLIDVAGLVPGAHEGKGLGNQFLTDLASTDCLIQVIDASGKTDLEGNLNNAEPYKEIEFLENELAYWIFNIIKRNWDKIRNRDFEKMYDIFGSMKISKNKVDEIIRNNNLKTERINWTDEEILNLSKDLVKKGKPIIIAANKIDHKNAEQNIRKIKKRTNKNIFPTYALGELILRKAESKGYIKYSPGNKQFEIVKDINQGQKKGLENIRTVLNKYNNTGVQQIINHAVFDQLNNIVVYPVEDDKKLCDTKGNILPDAILLKKGSTVIDLAEKIHSDIAKGFISAINVRTKRRIGKDYIVKNNDIIKIISK